MELKVNTLDVSLRIRYEKGAVTLREAAQELCEAGWYNYLPSIDQTLRTMYHKIFTTMYLDITPNHSKRTFTIRAKDNGVTVFKYRTIQYTTTEFQSMLFNSQNDWRRFLQATNDYYKV